MAYSDHPELPFLTAGAIAIVGGSIKNHGWPPSAPKAIIGTVVLVIAASATADSPIAPVVHALGVLLVVASLMAAVNAVQSSKKAPAKASTNVANAAK